MSDDVHARDDDTISDLGDAPPRRRTRRLRNAGVGVLVLIVAAAAFDLLGPRTGEASAQGAGYTMSMVFPQIARAGEPAPLRITLKADGGFGDTVQLRICDTWFDHLDFQSWYPNPSAETSTPGWVIYEFDPPPEGSAMQIRLDARVAPGQLAGRDHCEVSVLEDDRPQVTASFTTWRVP